jgi:hypothetical protein
MNPYLPNEELHSQLLDKMLAAGVRGGQNSDGSQKDGFLKYEKNKVVAIYDLNKGQYISISDVQASCDEKLGALPASAKPWKSVVGNPEKEQILKTYFGELKNTDTYGAQLAVNYALRSLAIGKKLVSDHVAHNEQDVNTVLLTGFFHAYGPINDYLN